MSYRIVIEKRAQKEANKIPNRYRTGIDKAVLSLASNPRPHGVKKIVEK